MPDDDELAELRRKVEEDLEANHNYGRAYTTLRLLDAFEEVRTNLGMCEAHVRQLKWQQRRAVEEIEQGNIIKGLSYIKRKED